MKDDMFRVSQKNTVGPVEVKDEKEYHTYLQQINFQLHMPTHYIQAHFDVEPEAKDKKSFNGWAHGQDPIQPISNN